MTPPGRYLAISGGVGGAKLALGLAKILPGDQLAIAVNTADDFQHLGLHISPDVDTLLYTLAGENNPETGWGRRNESWAFMQALQDLGGETWFQLGDRDLATNIERTIRLRKGQPLSQITADFAESFGIEHSIFPMSNDPVQTRVHTSQGLINFQDYFVREKCMPAVTKFEFDGAAQAQLNPDIEAWMNNPDLSGIILCPSNPFVSIDPILSIPGMRDRLIACDVPVVAVTPIVGGKAIKGPTAKIMNELSLPVTASWVAEYYSGFLNGFVLDYQDIALKASIEELNMRVKVTNTLMLKQNDKIQVAQSCLQLLNECEN